MGLRDEQRGFVLSGIALLLISPAILLAASSLKIIEIGGESTSIQVLADKVNYAGRNIVDMIYYMQNNRLPVNDEVLESLAENYSSATGLIVDISSTWVYPFWIHVQNTGVDHYAGTRYCYIEKLAPEKWNYSFEDLDLGIGQTVDFDYDEPILFVEKLGENLRVTVMAYNGGYHSDVYYSNNLLWLGVGGNDHAHIGENKVISENLANLFREISVEVRDSRGVAQYTENIAMT